MIFRTDGALAGESGKRGRAYRISQDNKLAELGSVDLTKSNEELAWPVRSQDEVTTVLRPIATTTHHTPIGGKPMPQQRQSQSLNAGSIVGVVITQLVAQILISFVGPGDSTNVPIRLVAVVVIGIGFGLMQKKKSDPPAA